MNKIKKYSVNLGMIMLTIVPATTAISCQEQPKPKKIADEKISYEYISKGLSEDAKAGYTAELNFKGLKTRKQWQEWAVNWVKSNTIVDLSKYVAKTLEEKKKPIIKFIGIGINGEKKFYLTNTIKDLPGVMMLFGTYIVNKYHSTLEKPISYEYITEGLSKDSNAKYSLQYMHLIDPISKKMMNKKRVKNMFIKLNGFALDKLNEDRAKGLNPVVRIVCVGPKNEVKFYLTKRSEIEKAGKIFEKYIEDTYKTQKNKPSTGKIGKITTKKS